MWKTDDINTFRTNGIFTLRTNESNEQNRKQDLGMVLILL